MLRYWHTLLDNLVFLTFLMPLVGILLLAVSSRLGLDAVRRIALTNVLLTFSLGALMVANFNPATRADASSGHRFQMTTSWLWLQRDRFHLQQRETDEGTTSEVLVSDRRGPNVRIAVGVDGVSLWFIMLAVALMIPATLAAWDHDQQHPALYHGLLLVLQAALIGIFAAVDVILFLICLELASLTLMILIGRWGCHGRASVVRRFYGFNFAGTLLIAFGLLAVVLSHARMRIDEKGSYPPPTFAVDELLFGGNADGIGARVSGVRELISRDEMARHYWDEASPWIFLSLMIGFALRAAMVPAHSWLIANDTVAPTSASVLLVGVALVSGGYGMARFVVPLFPGVAFPIAAWVPALGIMGGLYAGLLALSQDDMKRTAELACLGHLGLSVAGLFSSNASGIVGGLLLLVSTGLSVAALMLLISAMQRRTGSCTIAATDSLTRKYPRLGRWFLIAALAVIGVPGFGIFAGLLLTFRGLFESANSGGGPITVVGLLMIACVGWAFVRRIQNCFKVTADDISTSTHARDQAGERGEHRDLTLRETAGVAVCLGMSAWMGIYPAFFTSRMGRWPSDGRFMSSAAASERIEPHLQSKQVADANPRELSQLSEL